MKYFIWLISLVNVYFGITSLLNVFHILQNSKYSQASTAFFAVLFLCLGFGGFYFSILKTSYKLALLIGLGPWVISLILLLITMLTSDYK